MSTPQVNSENRSVYADWFLQMMDNILSNKEFFISEYAKEMERNIEEFGVDRESKRAYQRDALDFEEIIDSESFDVAAARYAKLDVMRQTAFGNIYTDILNDDGCEIVYTGGGIYCGLIRVDGGWFYGELNGWGGIWKTREQAIECIPDEEEGLVRIIENLDEQIGIMTRIYLAALSSDSAEVRCDLTDDDIKTLMRDMVSDIKSWGE